MAEKTNATPFDLASLDSVQGSDTGAELTVLHPVTGAPIDDGHGGHLTVRLAGPDSDVYRKAQREATNRRLSQRGRNNKITAEALEAESIDLLATCTLDWSKGWVFDGKELECNRENARLLYSRLPWLREQADEFIGDRANFMKS